MDKTKSKTPDSDSSAVLDGYTTIYACGPRKKCPDGTDHDYSLFEEVENVGTAVCSKCGHRAIDDAFWY